MNLLSIKFWFALLPAPFRPASFRLFLVVFIFFVVVGLGSKIVSFYKRRDFVLGRVALRLARPLFSTGIIGLILLFFEYERVSFLSSRFWYALLLIWFGYSLFRFVQYIIKKLPAERAELEKKTRLEKYLPK